MKGNRANRTRRGRVKQNAAVAHKCRHVRPITAYRQRNSGGNGHREAFNAPEIWHEPTGHDEIRYYVQPAGDGYHHPVTVDEVADRIGELPARFADLVEVVQFSAMTRKRALFPCYGMQWGPAVYLYPIESSLVETYVRPPHPRQIHEAKMFGGRWSQDGPQWQLEWTESSLKDFYLNNVLIHEIGHVNDDRNTSFDARERYANWFAIEYGFRASRGRI